METNSEAMTPNLNELRQRQEERVGDNESRFEMLDGHEEVDACVQAEADLRSLIDYTERLRAILVRFLGGLSHEPHTFTDFQLWPGLFTLRLVEDAKKELGC